MNRKSLLAPLAPLVAGLLIVAPAGASPLLTREFRYAAERVTLTREAGYTRVRVDGAPPEWRAGRPDLPRLSERVEVPAGLHVVRLEVAELETAPLADDAIVAPALEVRGDDVPPRATTPDAALYAAAGMQPETPVTLGYQGFERGNTVALLLVSPVRWSAAEHRLERVSRLVVRLVLEPTPARPLARERVVPEWEDARPMFSGPPASPAALRVTAGSRAAQPFAPTQIPSLLGSPVAYVIVTSDSLAPSFQPLADWKTQSGVPTAIRTTSFIRAQYPSASDDAERIRLFLRDAYTRWGTRWALLGGDTDVIPSRRTHMTFVDGAECTSDLYFSCLDGNWNANGDSSYADAYWDPTNPGDDADLLPEMYVGRAPVLTPFDVQNFVRKTLVYEKNPISDYMPNVLFFAQVITPEPWIPGHPVQFDGAKLVEQDMLPILDTTPWVHVARMYQNYTGATYRPGSVPETRAAVHDSLERGYNIAVHVGHGYREVMSCGDDNLRNNDMRELANGDRLMNFYAIDCTSNAIDYSSIGEALIRAPAGGAVTNIGSTTLDYPTFGRIYQKQYFRLLFIDSVTAVGEAQARQKLPFVGDSNYDGFNRLSQLSLLLLGDPELRIYTNTPRTLTVAAPGTFVASDSTVAVHVEIAGVPLYHARVTVYMPGHEFRSGFTDGAGDVTLPFRPDTLGSATLTVTAFNARPWQSALAVTAGGAPALGALAPVVIDDPNAGRQGNGDGRLDAGELVDLRMSVRNAGGSPASDVTGTLSSTDPNVTITSAGASYGAIAAGAVVAPTSDFRVQIAPGCPDQREIAFTLELVSPDPLHTQQRSQLTVHAPELIQVAHAESEEIGNGDGRPQPGETVLYTFRIRNLGTGAASGITGQITNPDGLSTLLDPSFAVPDLAPGTEADATPVRFVPASASARLALEVDDIHGVRLTQTLDLLYPAPITGLTTLGGAGLIHLDWAPDSIPDLRGYHVYRAPSLVGPFTKVSPSTPGRVSTLDDVGLAPLTRFYYEVCAVDSSGNESTPSTAVPATTNPALHAGFPKRTNENSDTPVAVDHLASGYPRDILTGGSVLHLFHPDGTSPVDADGVAATPGDLSTIGRLYTGGGSISDLFGNGSRQLIGAAWNTKQLLVCDTQGDPLPGFPVTVADPMWSSVAVADLDADGHREMVFAGLSHAIYAFHADGTEVIDGDANAGTTGIFKLVNGGYNPGTPALADLEGSGQKDIVYGSSDGFLYAWRPDGSNVPGFPVSLGAGALGSTVVGRLDGAGQPFSIVVPVNDNSLRVVLANGTPRPGFPVFLRTDGTDHAASPALADMNHDGFPDIVYASTNGRMYVFDRNGVLFAPWATARFSDLTLSAVQASPVVADINGDGANDVVVGDESGRLMALGGVDGRPLPGFPIQLDAEATGTAALCDCDGDGKSEIVDVDFGGTVRMWDYDFPYSPGGPAPWPQYQHDAERTGSTDTPAPVAVDPVAAAIPRVLELAAPRPNPARGAMQIAFGIPGGRTGTGVELDVFDLAGRHVRTLARGLARPGRVTLTWDLRDERGDRSASGVYLVRLRAGGDVLTRKVVALR